MQIPIDEKQIMVFVTLLEEGTPTIRGTQAIDLGNGTCRLLPTPNYDPEDEIWEFLPGSIVKFEQTKDYQGDDILFAYELVK